MCNGFSGPSFRKSEGYEQAFAEIYPIKDALKSFTQSLRLRPSSADCLFNLGNLYQRMGRLQDALDAWRNATA